MTKRQTGAWQAVNEFIDRYIYELAFVAATGATLASMVLSQVLGLTPCELCWYQRVFMFPLPFIFFAAIVNRDRYAYWYAWPLAIAGWLIAAYQTLLQWQIITPETNTCSLTGPSCAEPEINLLGFLTIPFGSLLLFSLINFLLWRARKLSPAAKIDQTNFQRAVYLSVGLAAVTAVAILLIRLFDVQV